MATTKYSADPEVTVMLKELSQRIASKPKGSQNVTDEDGSLDASPPGFKPAAVPGPEYKMEIVWLNVILYVALHAAAAYAYYLVAFSANLKTYIWSWVVFFLAAEGILLGAHRLYSHRSFKTTFIVRLLLVLCNTISTQNSMWEWVRDHRQHHKYSDTNADPHNASRGFFFAHIGWLCVRKHPDVFKAGREVDMSDIEADWLVMFQKKYYIFMFVPLSIVFPMAVPMYFWGETWWNSFFIAVVLRTVHVLNHTWMINSWAHHFGTRPFEKEMRPRQSLLATLLTLGEGWHNFHHTFPGDYRGADSGQFLNSSRFFIEALEKIGCASDLRMVSDDLVLRRALKTGDGTKPRLNAEVLAELDPKCEAESDPVRA